VLGPEYPAPELSRVGGLGSLLDVSEVSVLSEGSGVSDSGALLRKIGTQQSNTKQRVVAGENYP
jgi:hypothetical protein